MSAFISAAFSILDNYHSAKEIVWKDDSYFYDTPKTFTFCIISFGFDCNYKFFMLPVFRVDILICICSFNKRVF